MKKQTRPGSPLRYSVPASVIIILIVLLMTVSAARAADVEKRECNISEPIAAEQTCITKSLEKPQENEIEFMTEVPADPENPQPATPTELIARPRNKRKLTDEDFEIQYGDVTIRLGDFPEEALSEIEKLEEDEINKREVTNSIYAPGGVEYDVEKIGIRCTEENEISAIFVDTGDIHTSRGIKVGDSIEKVKEKYGENYTSIAPDLIVYSNKYKKDSPTVVFQMDGDEVFSFAIVVKNMQN